MQGVFSRFYWLMSNIYWYKMAENWASIEFLQKVFISLLFPHFYTSHLILVSVMRFTLVSLKVTWEMQFLNLSVSFIFALISLFFKFWRLYQVCFLCSGYDVISLHLEISITGWISAKIPHKMVKHKLFVGKLLMNCLSVFDHFEGLAIEELKKIKDKIFQ